MIISSALKYHYCRTWSNYFKTSILLLSQTETNSLFHLSLKNNKSSVLVCLRWQCPCLIFQFSQLIRRTEGNNAIEGENEGIFFIWPFLFLNLRTKWTQKVFSFQEVIYISIQKGKQWNHVFFYTILYLALWDERRCMLEYMHIYIKYKYVYISVNCYWRFEYQWPKW